MCINRNLAIPLSPHSERKEGRNFPLVKLALFLDLAKPLNFTKLPPSKKQYSHFLGIFAK